MRLRSVCLAVVAVALAAGSIHFLTDPQTGGAQSEPQSIQARIDQAAPGDTIYVDGGVYNERIVIDKADKLKGMNDPVIDGGDEGDVVLITASGASILDFVLRNGGKSISQEAAGAKVDGADEVEIVGNRIEDTRFGVYVRIGYLPQTPAFNEGDTCRQALEFLAELRGSDVSRVESLLKRVGLEEQIDLAVGHLSGGMKQRLALAAALLSDPPLLLLDEPTADLDAASREQLHDLVAQLRAEGRTIVISTHFVDNLGDLADHVLVLRGGRLVYKGTVEELASRAPSRRFVVSLNGTSPSTLIQALGEIGVKADSISSASISWDELLARVANGETDAEADE